VRAAFDVIVVAVVALALKSLQQKQHRDDDHPVRAAFDVIVVAVVVLALVSLAYLAILMLLKLV
jgi:hypothetical protein